MKRTILLAALAIAALSSPASAAVTWFECSTGHFPFEAADFCDQMLRTNAGSSGGGVYYAGVVPGGTVMQIGGQTVSYFDGPADFSGIPHVEPLIGIAGDLRDRNAGPGDYTYGNTVVHFDGQHVTSATFPRGHTTHY